MVLLACLLVFFLGEAGVAVVFALFLFPPGIVEVGGKETMEKNKLIITILIATTKPSEELVVVEPVL